MIKNVFFDLDGTLTDPGLGITNSVMYALNKMGYPVPAREKLYAFIGPPLIESFMKYFSMSDEEAHRAMTTYREYFADRGLFENTPYPGVGEALGRLRDMGFRLSVATSKPEKYSERILDHFGLSGYFETVCGASMDEKRSEKADVIRYALGRTGYAADETLMAGDRKHDILGAHACGLKAVGVLWGYGSEDEFREAGADYTVRDFDGLITLVRTAGYADGK